MSTSPKANHSADPGLASIAAAEGFEATSALDPDGLGAAGRTSLLKSGSTSVFNALIGRHDSEMVIRHRLEYAEPSIWLWRRIVGAAFAFIVMTITWYLVKVPSGLISDDALPTQTQVATAFNEVRSEGFAGATLSRHAGSSLFRLAFGLGIGSITGVSLGLMTGAAPLVRTVIDPLASFFRMVPAMAVAPLLIIWFGAGDRAMVSVVAFTVMWTALGSASDARVRSLRGAPVDITLEVVAAMRSALLLGWVTVLAIETVVSTTGLGSLIWSAQDRSDVIVVGIYIAGLMGFVLDTALRVTQYFLANAAARPARPLPTMGKQVSQQATAPG
ncbi:MAG: ABC transporter permease [Acidimicrobiales bacterium]